MEPTTTEVQPERVAPDIDQGTGSTGSTGSTASTVTTGTRRFLGAIALLALGAAAAWMLAAVLTASHGLDTSDEGAYLVSYRWWDSNLRTFTGSQYLYGPVFEVLGYNIAGLRLVRLLTVVVVHLAFGWTFMRWLRLRRPNAPDSKLWVAAGTAAIIACGGLVYGWLPLSPGYNDVSLLGALFAAAIVLRMATYVDRGSPVPAWLPALFGPVVVATLLAKWSSSALTLLVVAIVAVVALGPRGWREVLRAAAWALAGTLVSVGLVQFLIIPLNTALPEMLAVNQLAAAATNSPVELFKMYLTTFGQVLETIVRVHWVLLVAAVFAVVARGAWAGRIAAALAVLGVGVSAWRVYTGRGLIGGTVNLDNYPVGLLLVVIVAIIVGVGFLARERITGARTGLVGRTGRRGWIILAMIAILPFTQAAGTGNPVHYMAVNAYAAWAAVMIAILTGIESAPRAARFVTAAVAGGAVLLSSCIAVDGLWRHPYRTDPRGVTTATVEGVPALSSVTLSPRLAGQYADLYERLKPYVEPEGRAIMAFDEMAGIVLLLGGRPVGETWYSALDPARSAVGIRAECEKAEPWWGQRQPLMIFRRPVTQNEIDAVRSCGLAFETDYRLLAPKEETMGFLVYIPTAEAPRGQE